MGIKGIGKEGRLYIKFLAAAALLFTLVFALYALAANPFASLAIVTNANFSNANDSFGCQSKIVNERVRTK